MPVPKAALHLDDGAVPRKDDVRPSGEAHDVNAEAIAHPVQRAPDGELGLGVHAADAGHHLGALGPAERVGHG